jgi:hypothetical protein
MADQAQPDQPTQAQVPLNPDLAGFPNAEALVQAYRASSGEARKWREQAESAQRQSEQAAQGYNGYNGYQQNVRPDIPSRPVDPAQRLRDEGWPVDSLESWVNQVAEQKVAQSLQPLAQGFQARNQLLGQYPDYQKFEADVATFIASDGDFQARYNKMFAADAVAAMDYAFLKFGENRRQTTTNGGNGISPQYVTEAQIPSSRAGDARMTSNQGDRVQNAWEALQRSNNAETRQAFAKARLHNAIPDQFLNE